jgi:hypothetical protein
MGVERQPNGFGPIAARAPGAPDLSPPFDPESPLAEIGPVRPSTESPARGAGLAALDGAELKREHDQRRIRDLLDSPTVRTLFLVTDVQGQDAPRQVGDMLERTPRRHPNFGRMTLSQGIIIDPAHPGDAVVFAVVLDDREIEQLHTQLANQFPEHVTESNPAPDLLTQLGEVGQVTFLPGRQVADLILTDGPNRAIVRKHEPGLVPMTPGSLSGFPLARADEPAAPPPAPSDAVASSRPGPTFEQMQSGPHPSVRELREREAADRAATASRLPRRRESVVLVWVTTSPGSSAR